MTHLLKVEGLIAAWAAKDIPAVLSHLHDDITYRYALSEPALRGKTQVEAFLNRIKDHQRDTKWRIINSSETGDTVFIEALDDYTNPTGHRVLTPHVGIYEFKDGLIHSWRDYFDFGLLKLAETGQPLPKSLTEFIESLG